MRIPRIFTDQTIALGNKINLPAPVGHHIINVLRMTVGRSVILFNGSGGEYTGVIAELTKKTVSVEVTDFWDIDRESPLSVELAVCLIKNERMDWLVQKSTELGVKTISLLVSEYTDYKVKAERIEKKLQHWRQIAISACEQSARTQIPIIHPPSAFEIWLENVTTDRRYILHPHKSPEDHYNSIDHSWGEHNSASSLTLLVGPEGGFTETEVTSALDNQFLPLTLGPRILRAETAPLAALAIVQQQFGDLLSTPNNLSSV